MALVVAIGLLGVFAAGFGAAGTRRLQPTWLSRVIRLTAPLVVVGSAALILFAAATARVAFHLELNVGELAPGIAGGLRAAPVNLALLGVASLAAVFAVSDGALTGTQIARLLAGLLGTFVVVLAANLVVASAGLVVITAAALPGPIAASHGEVMGPRSVRHRSSIAGSAAVGLLVIAAAQLLDQQGTTDFASLPSASVAYSVALPWGLAAVLCLAAPGLAAVDGRRSDQGLAGMAATTIPAGVALLLHLVDAANGDLGMSTAVSLGVAAVAVSVGGGFGALRHHRRSSVLGWLCWSASGAAIGMAALAGTGRLAFAVAALACELLAMAAAAWHARSDNVQLRSEHVISQRAAAAALGTLVALLGFGAASGFVVVAAAAQDGGLGSRLLAGGLGGGAVLAALAALFSARHQFANIAEAAYPDEDEDGPRRPRPGAASVATVSMALGAVPAAIAAVVPGLVVAWLGQLVVAPVPEPDAFSVATAIGVWPGGYLAGAVAFVALAFWCIATLLGWRPAAVTHRHKAGVAASVFRRHVPEPNGLPSVAETTKQTRSGRALRLLRGGLRRTDAWLQGQPQMGTAVAVAVVALLVIR